MYDSPFCNCQKTLRAECAFSVNVQTFSLTATLVDWKLACYGKHVADLRFSRSEFPEYLCNRSRFDASLKQLIQFLRATCDFDDFLAALQAIGID
jgi:hypothetical protein